MHVLVQATRGVASVSSSRTGRVVGVGDRAGAHQGRRGRLKPRSGAEPPSGRAYHQAETGILLTRMLTRVDFARAGSQIAAEAARFLGQSLYSGVLTLGTVPAGNSLRLTRPCAEAHDVIALGLVEMMPMAWRRCCAELHAKTQPPGGAPDQHVIAGFQRMRRMSEQHAVGGGECQRVAGRFFPGEVPRLRH